MTEPHRLVPPVQRQRAHSAGRGRFAAGPRFFLLLLLGLVWLGPGWVDRRFLYALLAWDLGVMAVWLWDLRRLPQPEQLLVSRAWNGPLALSTDTRVALEVENEGGVAVLLALHDNVPPALRLELPAVECSASPRDSGTAHYTVRPVVRGDHEVGRVFLRCQSTLRLAERWVVAGLEQQVRVYPNLEEAKKHTMYLIRSRQIELEKRLKRRRGLGREFESLREYRDGDELRDICWTATARRGKPITKVYQIERSQTVWLVMDAGRLLRARTGGLTKLDFAVNAALSLAQVALYSGDRVGLLAYGRGLQQRLRPGMGPGHLRALVERLAQVRGEASEANHTRAAELLLTSQKRRSLVLWLTDLAETAATPEVIESAMQMTARHLVLFVVMGQPELRQRVHSRPATPNEMYRQVAAVEMVGRRNLLLRQLRQRGALTAELEPGQLATGLVNHYLDIKERSLL